MEYTTGVEYNVLSLQVVPLCLKVYGINCVEGYEYVWRRDVQWHVDKVKVLDDQCIIPNNFHVVTTEIPYNTFRYDFMLTFIPDYTLYPFSVKFPDLHKKLVTKWQESEQIKVLWQFHSPERFSRYQLDCLLRQYGDTFYPKCHPSLWSYELVGVWKGQ